MLPTSAAAQVRRCDVGAARAAATLSSNASTPTQQNLPRTSFEEVVQEHATSVVEPPIHPVPLMQGAFEESIMEAHERSQQRVRDTLDATSRRLQLLELEQLSDEFSSRWRQKPDAKFHPLWKIIAQISFGVHLLNQNKANSEDEVVDILQAHVNEVDGFLEDTTADFDLAIRDIDERARLLEMPLEHGRTFDKMLRDRKFRIAIMDGNDMIERVIARTTKAMKASLRDVANGIEAATELAKYLERIGLEWSTVSPMLKDVHSAMRGNAEGWSRAFKMVQDRGEKLTNLLARLESSVSEVAKRAAAASRRRVEKHNALLKAHNGSSSQLSTITASSAESSQSFRYDKPLPPAPLSKALAKSTVRRTEIPPSPEDDKREITILLDSPSLSLDRTPRKCIPANEPHLDLTTTSSRRTSRRPSQELSPNMSTKTSRPPSRGTHDVPSPRDHRDSKSEQHFESAVMPSPRPWSSDGTETTPTQASQPISLDVSVVHSRRPSTSSLVEQDLSVAQKRVSRSSDKEFISMSPFPAPEKYNTGLSPTERARLSVRSSRESFRSGETSPRKQPFISVAIPEEESESADAEQLRPQANKPWLDYVEEDVNPDSRQVDSAYSSCPETPQRAMAEVERRPTRNSVAFPGPVGQPRKAPDIPENAHKRNSSQATTALPTMQMDTRRDGRKGLSMRKPSLASFKDMLWKKPLSRQMGSGGLGGHVAIA